MSAFDIELAKTEYLNQFYQTLFSLIGSNWSGGVGGDIAAPRLALIALTKVKIDEAMKQSEGVQFNLEGSDNSNIIDLYLNAIMDEAGKHVLQTAPLHILVPDDGGTLTCVPIPDTNGLTGYVVLPDNYLRYVSFKMPDWLQEVDMPLLPNDPKYKLQKYIATRGGIAKPVVALNSRTIINTPVKQVDWVTFQGTDGACTVSGPGGLNKTATFVTSETITATNFFNDYAADYLIRGIVLTNPSAGKVVFTANVAGVPFSHPMILTTDADLTGYVVNAIANVPAREGKRILEYYSILPDGVPAVTTPTPVAAHPNHTIDKFLYIADKGAEFIQTNLYDAVTWMAASKLLQIWGEFSGNQSYADRAMKQVELSYQNLL
jgi:hypothetical protein